MVNMFSINIWSGPEKVSIEAIFCFQSRTFSHDSARYLELQPHDLRRTYAELGRRAGVPISQISKLLGHASIETTQDYLNIELDLETTISDFVPF